MTFSIYRGSRPASRVSTRVQKQPICAIIVVGHCEPCPEWSIIARLQWQRRVRELEYRDHQVHTFHFESLLLAHVKGWSTRSISSEVYCQQSVKQPIKSLVTAWFAAEGLSDPKLHNLVHRHASLKTYLIPSLSLRRPRQQHCSLIQKPRKYNSVSQAPSKQQ